MADRRKRNREADAAAVATEIRSEIRRIIRKWYGLQTPLQAFREVDRPAGKPNIQVLFGPSLLGDSPPKPDATGLQCRSGKFGLPDERISDAFHDFAGSVWHLGDRIRRWYRAKGTSADVVNRRIKKHVDDSPDLKICGDLITEKKHGAREERSGLHPWLSITHFDTSNSGQVEFFYDGAVKEATLLVSFANPVPFHVDIYRGDDPKFTRDFPYDESARIGNAVNIISAGFRHWLLLIRDLGIFDNDGREDNALVEILKPLCDLRVARDGHTDILVKMNQQDPKTAGDSATALFPHDLPRRTLAEMTTDIQAWFDRHTDLGISPHNRILRLCKTIAEITRTIEKDDPEWAEAVQSEKDIQEYWFILHMLNEHLYDAPFLARLKRSTDDPVLPVESGDDTHGRNYQFELLLAAVAARAGLKVEGFEGGGADWKFSATVRCWAVEAKRIKSWSAAEKRIGEAADQIQASKLGGVIALDVSVACNPDYQPMGAFVPDDVLHRAQRSRGEHLAANFVPDVKKWIGSAPVGFLLVYDYQIRPGGHSSGEVCPWSLMASWDRFNLLPPGSPQTDNFNELWSLFGAGLPQL